jgi:RNA polymerase sigma factor (sigma-70 family)
MAACHFRVLGANIAPATRGDSIAIRRCPTSPVVMVREPPPADECAPCVRAKLDRRHQPAFSEFYRTWYPRALRLIQIHAACREDAEDVAQSLFLRLLESGTWCRIRSPRNYLQRAALRELARRKKRSLPCVPLSEGLVNVLAGRDPAPDDHAALNELRSALVHQCQGLPRRCRAVVSRLLKGWTHHEIADDLGISRKAVEKQAARGRAILARNPLSASHHLPEHNSTSN